jgi:hypothetical protein
LAAKLTYALKFQNQKFIRKFKSGPPKFNCGA